MRIGGIQKVSLIDYPGKIAATIFVSGCNFNCGFCYNPELILEENIKNQTPIPQDSIYEFLRKRKNLIDGVVMCGGEPTIYKDLPEVIQKIKKMGFLIKLDTNGSNPRVLEHMFKKNLLDYVAMDIKTSKEKYSLLTGQKKQILNVERSVEILKEHAPNYEFRTTVVPGIVRKEDILKIARWIAPAKKYFLQQYRPQRTLDPAFKEIDPYPLEYLMEIQKIIAPHFDVCQIREQ